MLDSGERAKKTSSQQSFIRYLATMIKMNLATQVVTCGWRVVIRGLLRLTLPNRKIDVMFIILKIILIASHLNIMNNLDGSNPIP